MGRKLLVVPLASHLAMHISVGEVCVKMSSYRLTLTVIAVIDCNQNRSLRSGISETKRSSWMISMRNHGHHGSGGVMCIESRHPAERLPTLLAIHHNYE